MDYIRIIHAIENNSFSLEFSLSILSLSRYRSLTVKCMAMLRNYSHFHLMQCTGWPQVVYWINFCGKSLETLTSKLGLRFILALFHGVEILPSILLNTETSQASEEKGSKTEPKHARFRICWHTQTRVYHNQGSQFPCENRSKYQVLLINIVFL